MFGAFSPGDSLRVYRLQRRGVSLDLQRGLMHPHEPLWEAWLAFLTQQAMGQPTFVLNDPLVGEAFIQVRYRPHQAAADVVGLAPRLADQRGAADAWVRLLDGACIEAAGQGIRRVFANLPASGVEVDVFHQAGFTLYAAEDVFRRVARQVVPLSAPTALRPQRAEDWPALQKLCVAIVPQRVRQAEGGIALPASWEKNCWRYVLSDAGGADLVGALTVCASGAVHWFRVLVHPDARGMAHHLVSCALSLLNEQPSRTVYCDVRQYESGVQEALEEAGFEPFASRALMVKHTLVWLTSRVLETAPAIKGGAEPIPPAFRINGDSELANHDGQLAAEMSNE